MPCILGMRGTLKRFSEPRVLPSWRTMRESGGFDCSACILFVVVNDIK